MFDGIEQQSKNDDGRAITQCVKRQHSSTAVIEDAQQWLLRLWFDAMLSHIDRPDTIHRAGVIDGVLVPFRCGSPLFELAQEVRNVGFADRPSLIDVIAVESIGDRPTTGIGCFQRNPEQSFAYFDRLGAVVAHAAGVCRCGFRFTFGMPVNSGSLWKRSTMVDAGNQNCDNQEQQHKDHRIQQSWLGGRRRLGRADYATLRYINRIVLGHCPLV